MMHVTSNSPSADSPTADRDRGSVLTMVLALMVVGSLAVFALLNLATVLFMNRPPIEVRDRTFWSAKSAVSIAMVQQASWGPNGCFQGYKTFTINDFAASVTCQAEAPVTSGYGRYAVVTTSNDPSLSQLKGLGAGAPAKEISGKVFLNAGLIDASSADLNVDGGVTLSTYSSPQTPAARYLDSTTTLAADCEAPSILAQVTAGLPSPVDPACVTTPVAPDVGISWPDYVGDRAQVAEPRSYPALPPLPPYTRQSVNQATVGSCQVFFPGQYNSPLTLGSGNYYFASGIYYFTEAVTLQPGARVVAGEGKFNGCAVDAEAVYAPNAPKAHSVTGKGATFVFGGAGRLVSDNAKLQMNRRISDVSTRGTEATAFRSVNFLPSATPPPATPAPVEIRDDLVMIADTHDAANPKCTASSEGQPCLQAARDYTSQASADASVRSYTPSSLGVNDTIISVTQTGGNWGSNRFDVDGYTFVPNARVLLNGGNNADYRTRIDGGIVASSLEMQYNQMPSIPSNWFLGVRETNLEQRFNFYANVDAGNGQRTVSRATLQVDEDGNYAINGWTVDPNAQSTTPPPTPDPTPTPGPPPPPPDPDPTPPPPPDPDPDPDPDPVTPPTGGAPCNVVANNWTRDFGVGIWAAEYRNLAGNAPTATPFGGTPTVTDTVSQVRKADDNSSPIAGINVDDFSARFTQTFESGAACSIQLRMAGDDGTRVFVNGAQVLTDWTNHSYREAPPVTLVLPEGSNTIVFEFYERGGSAGYELVWKSN